MRHGPAGARDGAAAGMDGAAAGLGGCVSWGVSSGIARETICARVLSVRRQEEPFVLLEIYDFALEPMMMLWDCKEGNFASIHKLNAMLNLGTLRFPVKAHDHISPRPVIVQDGRAPADHQNVGLVAEPLIVQIPYEVDLCPGYRRDREVDGQDRLIRHASKPFRIACDDWRDSQNIFAVSTVPCALSAWARSQGRTQAFRSVKDQLLFAFVR